MPSCVVKCCHNNSGLSKKHEGITYHRFPKANEPWQNEWIQIIRECRGENVWNPSKSSVICSVHFEDTDLYTTKNGLVRVRLYAVPKKFLLEPPISHDELPDEQPIRQTIGPTEEQPMAGTSKQCTKNPAITTFEHPFEQSVEKHVEEPVNEHISCYMDRDLATPVDVEEPLTSLYTPQTRRLKQIIFNMRIQMKNKNKKIKILNQKIRRLQNRNKSLKQILKSLT